MRTELLDRGQRRQRFGIPCQVVKSHQRMGLAATVGQFELADGLVVPAREALGNVPREVP